RVVGDVGAQVAAEGSRDQCRRPASLVEGFVGLGLISLVEPGVQRDRLDVQLLEQAGKHQGGAAVVKVDQDLQVRLSHRLDIDQRDQPVDVRVDGVLRVTDISHLVEV